MGGVQKLLAIVRRNTKCYFKDKVTFFMSLLVPLLLLILFVTFLRNVYIDSFKAAIGDFAVDDKVLSGMAGAWLMSSIISVCPVTVAFLSNTIMIDDKVNNAVTDFTVSPVNRLTVQVSYFISNFFVTLIVMLCVMAIGHIYLAAVGWYITVGDFFMIIVDCIICILFGTLLAGIIESFISTQGGTAAVSSIVSSMYGFICGAYMPISTFSEGLRNVICMLPGTYSVGIVRNHYMNGYLQALADSGIPKQAVEGLKEAFDAELYLFGNSIPLWAMYTIILCTCVALAAAYTLIIIFKGNKKR